MNVAHEAHHLHEGAWVNVQAISSMVKINLAVHSRIHSHL